MARRFPVATSPPQSLVPWWIAHSDLVPANNGHIEFTRDLVIAGMPQKHLAFYAPGEYEPRLGLIAIRCVRRMGATGEEVTPISMALPDDSVFGVDVELQSNPRRTDSDDGTD